MSDHHTAPGKRRFTRGNGEMGQARERSLTDSDGSCVELMSGIFCGEQPEAIWLAPCEERRFVQYVLPYQGIGAVKNATREAAVGLEIEDNDLTVRVYVTQSRRVRIVLEEGFSTLLEEDTHLSPAEVYEQTLECTVTNETMLQLSVYDLQTNALLAVYRPQADMELHIENEKPVLKTAEMPGAPESIETNEELYLAGQRIEHHRFATRRADAYYKEGLKRDPGDIRLNTAYGRLLMRKGDFAGAKEYLEKAYARMTACDLGTCSGETAYDLALCEMYEEQYERAYDYFYRASWSEDQQAMSFYYLAALDARAGRWRLALDHVGKALAKNAHLIHARGLQAYLLRRMGQPGTALRCCRKNLEHDVFDFVSANEVVLLGRGKAEELDKRMQMQKIIFWQHADMPGLGHWVRLWSCYRAVRKRRRWCSTTRLIIWQDKSVPRRRRAYSTRQKNIRRRDVSPTKQTILPCFGMRSGRRTAQWPVIIWDACFMTGSSGIARSGCGSRRR